MAATKYRVLRGIDYKQNGVWKRAEVGDFVTLPAKIEKSFLAHRTPAIEKVTNG